MINYRKANKAVFYAWKKWKDNTPGKNHAVSAFVAGYNAAIADNDSDNDEKKLEQAIQDAAREAREEGMCRDDCMAAVYEKVNGICDNFDLAYPGVEDEIEQRIWDAM